ncbi:MAG: c-type cytochrome domain-containing protein, partial [Planctomycetaceae bacterium]
MAWFSKFPLRRDLRWPCLLLLLITGSAARLEAQNSSSSVPSVEFGRDIRPVLARHCWKCHGPDAAARQAGLRLDERESATVVLPSGGQAIR